MNAEQNWETNYESEETTNSSNVYNALPATSERSYYDDINVASILRDAGGYFDEHTNSYLTLAQALNLSKVGRAKLQRPKIDNQLAFWPYGAPVSGQDQCQKLIVAKDLVINDLPLFPKLKPTSMLKNENANNFFAKELFEGIDMLDMYVDWEDITYAPKYTPKWNLTSLKEDKQDASRDRGVDKGMLKSLPLLEKAWEGTNFGMAVSNARNDVMKIVNTHIRCNGSLKGQLNRLRDANRANAILTSKREIIPIAKWNAFMKKAFPLPEYLSLFPEGLPSYNKIFDENLLEILMNMKINLDADAGPCWQAPGTNFINKQVLVQDLLLSKEIWHMTCVQKIPVTDKYLEWTRLCKMKPKEEVYAEEDIAYEKKTRNYYAPTPATYKPVAYFYYKYLKHSPCGYEDQSLHLLGFNAFDGGMNRLIKHALKKGAGWSRIFSDNLYVIGFGPDNKKYWMSIDGSKMESCSTRDTLSRFFKLVTNQKGIHSDWAWYLGEVYPSMCIDFLGLIYQIALTVKGLGSGTLATGLANTIKMAEFAYWLTVESKGIVRLVHSKSDDAIQMGKEKWYFDTNFLNAATKAGLKLTLECLTPVDDLENPKRDQVYKLDMLGFDTVYLPEVDSFVPVLAKDRLCKALAFKKRSFEKNLPIAYPIAVEFSKMRSLWLTGAWFYPGLREIVWSKMHELAAALATNYIDKEDMVEYLVWLLNDQMESENQVYDPMSYEAAKSMVESIAGVVGPMSQYSVYLALLGRSKANAMIEYYYNRNPSIIPSVLTYAEFKDLIDNEPSLAEGLEDVFDKEAEFGTGNILLRYRNPDIEDRVRDRKAQMLVMFAQTGAIMKPEANTLAGGKAKDRRLDEARPDKKSDFDKRVRNPGTKHHPPRSRFTRELRVGLADLIINRLASGKYKFYWKDEWLGSSNLVVKQREVTKIKNRVDQEFDHRVDNEEEIEYEYSKVTSTFITDEGVENLLSQISTRIPLCDLKTLVSAAFSSKRVRTDGGRLLSFTKNIVVDDPALSFNKFLDKFARGFSGFFNYKYRLEKYGIIQNARILFKPTKEALLKEKKRLGEPKDYSDRDIEYSLFYNVVLEHLWTQMLKLPLGPGFTSFKMMFMLANPELNNDGSTFNLSLKKLADEAGIRGEMKIMDADVQFARVVSKVNFLIAEEQINPRKVVSRTSNKAKVRALARRVDPKGWKEWDDSKPTGEEKPSEYAVTN